jgi:hypothetical protein
MLTCYILSVLWYIYSDIASEKPLLRWNHVKWIGMGIVDIVGHSVIVAQESHLNLPNHTFWQGSYLA